MIEKILATPYNDIESMGWLLRYLTGPSGKNTHITNEIKSPYIFNEEVRCKYRLTAVGDIMGMRGKRLTMQSSLREFISDSDYLVGNFEGVITVKRPDLWPIPLYERHDAAIAEYLSGFFPPDKTYLSVSNNHACDFGEEEFFKSTDILRSNGFNVFGTHDKPHIDINENLRLISGTMWSNLKCPYVSRIENAERYIRDGTFNLLYPHAGYEFELYPRPETMNYARRAVSIFDAIIAHHPHCPQPVTAEGVKSCRKLLAYSLGNFCCGLEKRIWHYGIVMKIEIGQNDAGKWLIRMAEWKYTECVRAQNDRFIIRPVDNYA